MFKIITPTILVVAKILRPPDNNRGKYDQGHAVHQDDKTTFKTTRRHAVRQRRQDVKTISSGPPAGVAVLALVLVFGPRSLRFVEYSPGILLDRFIAIGVYALRFTGPHRLATTRFPRRRPFLSSRSCATRFRLIVPPGASTGSRVAPVRRRRARCERFEVPCQLTPRPACAR